MMTALRVLAIGVAIGAFIDPALKIPRRVPVTVRVFAPPDHPGALAAASRIRSALSGRVEWVDAGSGDASVLIGHAAPAAALRSDKPVSIVSLDEPTSARIVGVPGALTLVPGAVIEIPVRVRAIGLRGERSAIVLEQDGVELARAEHVWDGDGVVTVPLPYVAPSAGSRRLTVRVEPRPGQRRLEDSRADLLVNAVDRPARVAVVEGRPSWSAGFVRRALEADPAFRVSSVMRVSTGIASHAGEAPPVLVADQLSRFDVIIVGGPEELRRSEVDVLWQFAQRRGGTVMLLPDKSPSGPYAERLPGKPAEQLLTEPRVLEPSRVLASEVLTFGAAPPGGRVLATLGGAPAIVSWPAGDGRMLFSGALDAWRYRAEPKSDVTRFWRDELLSAAMAAPPPVQIEIAPAVVRPGGVARIDVRLRRTEFEDGVRGVEIVLPPVSARVSDPSGMLDTVRLWPGAETGTFHGEVSALAAGVHTVRVTSGQQARAETMFLVSGDAKTPAIDPGVLDDMAQLTGGVVANVSGLEPLVDHLAGLPRRLQPVVVRPFRSAWWTWILAALLCGEWTLRRRAGLR